ncbi:MAG: nicotinate-nucleotide adenylyltransferase [Pseudomonadota bacterium]
MTDRRGAGPAFDRVGVLGGTFDPVHIGHLRPALEALETLGLDEVRLVPCHLTPHRPQPGRSTAFRAQLVASAVASERRFVLDDREMLRDAPSYTFDTLQSMSRQMPSASLYFMLGVDSLNGLDRWHRWDEILGVSHLVLLRRPGHQLNAFANGLLATHGASAAVARTTRAGCIVTLDTIELQVSSTELRGLLSRGGDPRYLVPDSVRDILLESTAYRECHD